MLNLASELSDLREVRGQGPWPGHEYVKGWGMFGLPFDSGHVLALRVFPENSFGPYRTVWHRDPAGRWSIHVDGERSSKAGPALTAPLRTVSSSGCSAWSDSPVSTDSSNGPVTPYLR